MSGGCPTSTSPGGWAATSTPGLQLEADQARERLAAHLAKIDRLATRFQAKRMRPHEQREVLVLAYFGSFTQSEIAKHLGVPLGTVKARAFRGLHRLAELVGRSQ